MNDVILLMREYFKNRDELKGLKAKRMTYGTENPCEGMLWDGEYCYLNADIEHDEFCDACKTRHELFLRAQKLSYRNVGIMLKVRSITKKR